MLEHKYKNIFGTITDNDLPINRRLYNTLKKIKIEFTTILDNNQITKIENDLEEILENFEFKGDVVGEYDADYGDELIGKKYTYLKYKIKF